MPETDPPEPVVEAPSRDGPRVSAVWLVPLLALVVALAVAWRTYSGRGPMIEILFDDASGIEAGQTTVRFRNVTVGVVEDVTFTPDLRQVIVRARMDQDVAQFVDTEAAFWPVRPSVTAQGVTGIETVISGVYIEAFWDDTVGERQTRFEALPRAPLTAANEPGLRIRLRAPDGGSVAVGAPVLYKRIQVGTIENVELTEAGDVLIDAFVEAPHHELLSTATRFWNASGFSIELGLQGASLNVESLIALLQGGVAFDTVGGGPEPVATGHLYQLFPTESAARQNLVVDEPGERLLLTVEFEGSARGLQPGAAVEYRGIRVGQVTALEAAVASEGEARELVLRATLALVPERFGVQETAGIDVEDAALDVLAAEVERGLRARLASSGLLAETLYVDLAMVPDAPPATLDRNAEPPVLPSAPSQASGLAGTAEGVMQRIQNLPIEELIETATTLLANVNLLVTDDGIRAAPENLGLLLADLRALIADERVQEAPAEVAAILAAVRGLVDQATERQLVATLAATLEEAQGAVASIGTAADGVPDLVTEIEALVAGVSELPLDQLVASANELVNDVEALVASEQVAALPASLDASLTEVRQLVADLRGAPVENLNATLASARAVIDEVQAAQLAERLGATLAEVETAAAEIGTAAEGLPALMESLRALTARASELPLEDLVASGTQVLDSADAFLASEGVQNVPPRLAAAIEEARTVLVDLREGGAVGNVNATLASARSVADELASAELAASLRTALTEAEVAAANVSAASDELPTLIDNLTALSDRASGLPLEDLVGSATRVLDTADAFLASEGVASVPPQLAAALEEVRGMLAELREGGAVANVNATLASADRAAEAVTAAAADLPSLVAELSQVADQAEVALASFRPGSEINRDTLLVLREVREAARAVNALVTALERRPNSVLFGR